MMKSFQKREKTLLKQYNNKENNQNITTNSNNNILVTYFSATGTTQNIAEYIAEGTNGKLIEIVPKEKSSSSTKSEVSTWIQDLNIK